MRFSRRRVGGGRRRLEGIRSTAWNERFGDAGSFARAGMEGKPRQDFAVVGELDAAEVAGADARLVLLDAALEGE